MNEPDKMAEWTKIIEFYNDLITNYHWKQEPMLVLIEKLKTRNFWNHFFPSTSHEALGLSTEYNYEARCEKSMVYIRYDSDNNEFIIHFQEGQGNTTKEKVCGTEISENEFKIIEEWLNKTTPTNA